VSAPESCYLIPSGYVNKLEMEQRVLSQPFQAMVLKPDVIGGTEIVGAQDAVSLLRKKTRHVATDESGRACNQYVHEDSPGSALPVRY
jgi:hypothetical protein